MNLNNFQITWLSNASKQDHFKLAAWAELAAWADENFLRLVLVVFILACCLVGLGSQSHPHHRVTLSFDLDYIRYSFISF